MRKRKLLVTILILLIGIQLVPVAKNENEVASELDFLSSSEAPQDVKLILKTSCYDCHSDNTNYPWYGRIRPFVWVIQKHIDDGKKDLNFSSFHDYSGRMKREKIRSMISQIDDEEMPLKEYLWMHPEAKLEDHEKKQLIDFLEILNAQNH